MRVEYAVHSARRMRTGGRTRQSRARTRQGARRAYCLLPTAYLAERLVVLLVRGDAAANVLLGGCAVRHVLGKDIDTAEQRACDGMT